MLINSWGTSLRVWDQVINDLSVDHHVISYDWRGCGRSDRTFEGNTIGQNAIDLVRLIDVLCLERPTLVGSSVGSLFALEAARLAGDRIGGLTVLDGPGHCHWAPNLADLLNARMRSLSDDRAAAITSTVKNNYTDRVSEALLTWTSRQLLDASPHIDSLFLEQATYDPRSWIPALQVPILYIHGTEDKAVPTSVPTEMAALTGSDVVLIDEAGHLSQQEQPVQVSAAIRAFVANSQPAGV